jgi:uracil-DNA glycosylase family 4
MDKMTQEKLPTMGNKKADVLVVCDPPSAWLWQKGLPIGGDAIKLFARIAEECGFSKDDFYFVSPCPPIPEEIESSDKRINDFVNPYREQVLDTIQRIDPALIVYLGKWAGRIVMGRPQQIMKARGSFTDTDIPGLGRVPVLPMLSPGHVLRRPEMHDIFRTDFYMVERLRDLDWSLKRIVETAAGKKDYRWCTDLSELMKLNPKHISVDTETTGLMWYTGGTDDPNAVKILTVQIGYAPGKAFCVPVDCAYYPDLTPKKREKLLGQLKVLLEDPAIKKAGHNMKYDTHVLREDLGIYIDYTTDTQLLAFVVDENMQEKSLDECVRRWVPEMAGYNDEYNKKLDKSNMRSVSHDDMLNYGCGDADASYRLAVALTQLAKADKKQWRCYQKIIFPAIKSFCDPVEFYGIRVNTKVLSQLQKDLQITEREIYANLIEQVPPVIKRKHAEKGLKFTRDAFTRDILFSRQGLKLVPKVFTKSTAKLPPDQRIPSVSTKQHLPYFQDEPFVAQLMEYIKLQKLRGTYVGVPFDEEKGAPTGFWKYIYNGEIHPSFMLHRVVTGRTASENPNGQNFPKRGKLAKTYRKIFQARPGYVLLETDLSQAELRIAAWMANEKTMLKIYREGGDIHAMTAAHTMGLSLKQFMAQEEEVIEQKRFQAKAINFGFLYGMGWRKFKTYAKTDYGLDFTDQQAEQLREAFFDLYPCLVDWHESTRAWVREKGYVRALHGAVRHLPSINSADDYIRQECERQAINAPVQRFASDLGLMAMVRLTRDANPEDIRPIMFVHDALVVEVREEYADEAMGWVKFYMESPPLKQWFNLNPPVPIIADLARGYNLGEMDKCKGVKAVAPDWYRPEYDAA